MLSRSVSFMSQLILNLVLIISQICLVPKWLRLNCEGSATSLRRFWDTGDDFGTILQGILLHKIFEHVQNFRDYFKPLGNTCKDITNHWWLFRDCFATHSRCLLPAVAKQSQSSEMGALADKKTMARFFRIIPEFRILRQTFNRNLPNSAFCNGLSIEIG